jgi:zinc transport system ATP-binding protein
MIDIMMENVSFSYGNKPVLENISLRIPRGEFVAVIGPNGGGKTTLLKLLLGLLKPDEGRIRILGDPPEKAVSRLGYVPQDTGKGALFPVTVVDTVLMGCIGKERTSAADVSVALDSLERVGILNLKDELTGDLSQGQRQRVYIARALASDPEILLLDEPTASVDSDTQKALYDTLHELNEKITILIVSHDLFAVTSHATSVACVNKRICYHDKAEIKPDMLDLAYGTCPVELIAHGIPHRVLGMHGRKGEQPGD